MLLQLLRLTRAGVKQPLKQIAAICKKAQGLLPHGRSTVCWQGAPLACPAIRNLTAIAQITGCKSKA